jgi:hypothetical protein
MPLSYKKCPPPSIIIKDASISTVLLAPPVTIKL